MKFSLTKASHSGRRGALLAARSTAEEDPILKFTRSRIPSKQGAELNLNPGIVAGRLYARERLGAKASRLMSGPGSAMLRGGSPRAKGAECGAGS